MLSLVRPPARADFAAESRVHLDALRAIDAGGVTIVGKHFGNRELWKTPKHKKALVGDSWTFTKCAWCERHFEWKRQLDVEHYRPKAEVTHWEGAPPLVSNEPPKQVRVSGGYWWLAFEWSNYSLACGPCNQGWKRNLFPVRGARATQEGMEAQEVPLLLDPMSPFRTADHFSWTELGIMSAESDSGAATIITCGLNREQLVARRVATTQNVLGEIERLRRGLHNEVATRRRLRKLRELCDPASEFAGMNRWWVERTLGWTWDMLVKATTDR